MKCKNYILVQIGFTKVNAVERKNRVRDIGFGNGWNFGICWIELYLA